MSLRLWIALSAAAVLVNCDESCPDGYLHQNHVCVPGAASATGGSAAIEDSGTSTDAGEPPQNACTDKTFGDVCTLDADCGCDTTFCAIPPGSQQGICSHKGCLEKPEVCPADWKCTDFSAYQAGFSLCTPPGT